MVLIIVYLASIPKFDRKTAVDLPTGRRDTDEAQVRSIDCMDVCCAMFPTNPT
jgi:hypothetical protein